MPGASRSARGSSSPRPSSRLHPHERKLLFLRHARYEEEFGYATRVMAVYDEAAGSVPASDRMSVYEAYSATAAELAGVPKVRQVYEQAIESGGLQRRDALALCLRLAVLEEGLGEAGRVRAVCVHASGYADHDGDEEISAKWSGFKVRRGDEHTFKDMLQIKRTQKHAEVQAHGQLKDEKRRSADQLDAPHSKRQRANTISSPPSPSVCVVTDEVLRRIASPTKPHHDLFRGHSRTTARITFACKLHAVEENLVVLTASFNHGRHIYYLVYDNIDETLIMIPCLTPRCFVASHTRPDLRRRASGGYDLAVIARALARRGKTQTFSVC
ncbi:hypothetical protein E2562_014582 [Oryza meyeriana var. granulata]|uniref:Pre-mRNA-splicing factor Syf1/CRNKL1-like C-terminal HAT-repeats domain-containing protein n=1 Tax=Oryza meyeriana var. granulata TaxID=110450 RepID=A0A6G1DYS9_9ORYZ|nr:hypothetical protein E2562_014582 [Oryza meyeriana var. granulata]